MKFFFSLVWFSILTIGQSGDWEYYIGKPYIDQANATEYLTFENTPESVVTFFYASKIRNDKQWLEVVPLKENRSIRLSNKLDHYHQCTFTRFRLIGKKDDLDNRLWLKIYMEIENDGEVNKAVSKVSVELIEGHWLITSVPS